jgi:hypothetical protein
VRKPSKCGTKRETRPGEKSSKLWDPRRNYTPGEVVEHNPQNCGSHGGTIHLVKLLNTILKIVGAKEELYTW